MGQQRGMRRILKERDLGTNDNLCLPENASQTLPILALQHCWWEQDMCLAYLQGILIWTWQPGAYCEDSYNKSPAFFSSQRRNCSSCWIIWLQCGLPSISNTESISNSWQMSFLALHSFLTHFSVSLTGNTELIGKIREGLLQLLGEKVGADRRR